jgi:hypothetical protein
MTTLHDLTVTIFNDVLHVMEPRNRFQGTNSDSQCSVFGPPGSGSGYISQSEVWIRLGIRILLSLSKNSKKTLDFYCFVTSF